MAKRVHFVRHAQGEHNVAGEADRANYLKPDYLDSVLSPLGLEQCENLNAKLREKNHLHDADLIVVSPMRRTLQTATVCFRHHVGVTPFLALESLREQAGRHPCDNRLPISEHRPAFPHVNFDEIEHELDPLYPLYPDCREPAESINQRARDFFDWLLTRDEENIIVVTHSAYLQAMFLNVLNVEYENGEDFVWFENCEMRSFHLELPHLKAKPHPKLM